MKTLQLQDGPARRMYADATPEVRQILEDSFGKAFFSLDVTERIKTYEDACAEFGATPIDESAMLGAGFTPDEITYRKLKTITAALNEGWHPDWDNSDQRKWVPWFDASAGFAFSGVDFGYSAADAGNASRLCFKTNALAEYAGCQFNDLYRDFIK